MKKKSFMLSNLLRKKNKHTDKVMIITWNETLELWLYMYIGISDCKAIILILKQEYGLMLLGRGLDTCDHLL